MFFRFIFFLFGLINFYWVLAQNTPSTNFVSIQSYVSYNDRDAEKYNDNRPFYHQRIFGNTQVYSLQLNTGKIINRILLKSQGIAYSWQNTYNYQHSIDTNYYFNSYSNAQQWKLSLFYENIHLFPIHPSWSILIDIQRYGSFNYINSESTNEEYSVLSSKTSKSSSNQSIYALGASISTGVQCELNHKLWIYANLNILNAELNFQHNKNGLNFNDKTNISIHGNSNPGVGLSALTFGFRWKI